MPTYDYRCRDCGHEFEAVQSFSDDALTECPQCGGEGMLLGQLGNVSWYRCRQCGWDFNDGEE